MVPIPRSIAEVLDRGLREAPDREALVGRSTRLDYRTLDHRCAQAATALADLGVRSGDRVAASLPNDVDVVVAFHGAMRLGAIWVGVNRALAGPEKSFLLGDSAASVLLLEDGSEVPAAAAGAADLRALVTASEWREAVAAAAPTRDLPAVDPHAPAGIAYTSGTTGRPKGVVHSQHNLLVPGAALVSSRGWGPSLRKGDCLPLTILNLQVLSSLLTAQAGGTAVVMDQLHAAGVAEWIARESITVWNGPPALLHSLVEDGAIDPAALRTLTEVWSGGSDLPEALRRRFRDRFRRPVIGTYGLTEAPTVVSIDPPDGSFRSGASGRVLPHLEVQVLDDTGVEIAEGPGELALRPAGSGSMAGTYTPFLGYWGRDDLSGADVPVRTGDIGTVDEDGWLRVVDRRNLVIIRGGANVYPAEVERVLHGIPGVAGSAVFGVPDERLGERIAAAVELDPGADLGEDELRASCEAELARYKVPERIAIVDALPRNAMGKVDRTALGSLVPRR